MRRKSTPAGGDQAVTAGRTAPEHDCAVQRPILRRPGRAKGCRASRGQGSGLLVEGRSVAVGPVLPGSWFSIQIPAKSDEQNHVSMLGFTNPTATKFGVVRIGNARSEHHFSRPRNPGPVSDVLYGFWLHAKIAEPWPAPNGSIPLPNLYLRDW